MPGRWGGGDDLCSLRAIGQRYRLTDAPACAGYLVKRDELGRQGRLFGQGERRIFQLHQEGQGDRENKGQENGDEVKHTHESETYLEGIYQEVISLGR